MALKHILNVPSLLTLKPPLRCRAYYHSSSKRFITNNSNQFLHKRRNILKRSIGTSKIAEKKNINIEKMEESSDSTFNKKRMEGRDNRPKQLKLKTRNVNPVSTVCYVQVLGTGMDTQDTSPSVLLFFDQQRFIFNVGEGMQRFCTEYRLKLSKLDHLFLTRVCSETAGGLAGLLLTMASIGEEGMTANIWGPSDIEYLSGAMRSFVPNAAVLHTHSFHSRNLNHVERTSEDSLVLIKDEIVQISAVILLPVSDTACNKILGAKTSEDIIRNAEESQISMDMFCDKNETTVEKSNVYKKRRVELERSRLKEAELQSNESYRGGDVSVVYICELPEIKGKFDPAKAQARGLRPGPKYRELQLGKSVMSDTNNTMVHPSDVLDPSIPGPVVIIVDCPTVSHLPALLLAPAFNKFYIGSGDDSEENRHFVNCIIHLSPSLVTKRPEYREWMSKFGDTQHIMAGHQEKHMDFPVLKSSGKIATKLNFLCPQLFPSPVIQGTNDEHITLTEMEEVSNTNPKKIIPADNLLKFWLRPYSRLGLDTSSVPAVPTVSGIIDELCQEIPEIADISKQVSQLILGSKEQYKMTESSKNNHSVTAISKENCTEHMEGVDGLELDNRDTNHSSSQDQFNSDADVPPPECLKNVTREEMEIVFLGTGSSQPSKYRNVSSIFINLFSQGGILLDCGEGTLAQLKRRFGIRGADDIIKSLKFIWISHIHADHHTGLARILSVRQQLLKNEPHEPILVIGPGPLKRFLDAYSRMEDLGMHFIDCKQTTKDAIDAYEKVCAYSVDQRESNLQHGIGNANPAGANLLNLNTQGTAKAPDIHRSQMQSYWNNRRFQEPDVIGLRMLKRVLSEAGLEVLTSIPVIHCPQAFAIVLEAQQRQDNISTTLPGWKLAYSGDTRPCQALVDAAQGATVLIHEATFDDSLPEEAISRNHSSTKEAIEVGVSAGAYRIILTHFSQRYPKIPVFDGSYTNRTCIAFDLMTVNLADLPFVPKINPYLKLLFKDDMMVDEENETEKLHQEESIAP